MPSQQSKENILKRIREALATPTQTPVAKPDFSAPIYSQISSEPSVQFAEVFVRNKGEFFFCENEQEFISSLQLLIEKRNLQEIYVWETLLNELLKKSGIAFKADDTKFKSAEVGITLCECLVARTGSIIITSRQEAGRRLGIYPPIHIVVAFTSQLVADIKDGLQMVQAKYPTLLPSMISMITGPSRTADIEKTLVLGAHGPKELILFLIED
jgi:L-lactate dehydrogenase complex protein LldG